METRWISLEDFLPFWLLLRLGMGMFGLYGCVLEVGNLIFSVSELEALTTGGNFEPGL